MLSGTEKTGIKKLDSLDTMNQQYNTVITIIVYGRLTSIFFLLKFFYSYNLKSENISPKQLIEMTKTLYYNLIRSSNCNIPTPLYKKTYPENNRFKSCGSSLIVLDSIQNSDWLIALLLHFGSYLLL